MKTARPLPFLFLGCLLCSSLALPPSQSLMKSKLDPIRMDVGSSVETPGANAAPWTAEHGFTGGEAITRDLPKVDVIYRSERAGDFNFSETVPNGKYTVTLYFCETEFKSMDEAKGKRSFNIKIENVQDPIKDLSRAAGGVFKPLVKIYEVTVRDGKLDMTFTSTPQDKSNFRPACLSAMEVSTRSSGKPF